MNFEKQEPEVEDREVLAFTFCNHLYIKMPNGDCWCIPGHTAFNKEPFELSNTFEWNMLESEEGIDRIELLYKGDKVTITF